MRVLFVCTGNICRSPAAQAVAEGLAERLELRGWSFDSAGTTSAHAGEPAHALSRKVGQARGWAVTHVSRALRAEDGTFELLVAMDRGHLEELRRLYPGARDRIVLLRSWDSEVPEGEDADVDDPWSHPERAYVSMFGVLERSVEGLLRARGRLGR